MWLLSILLLHLLQLSGSVSDALPFGRLLRATLFLNLSSPFGKTAIVLLYNGFCFTIGLHKRLYIGITFLFECIRDFIQPAENRRIPDDYREISFVCLSPDGVDEVASTVGIMYRTAHKKVEELEGFHCHKLRHAFTSNLLSNGVAPKDVKEHFGHADINTTMNIYALATKEAKRSFAKLLDEVVGEA